MSEPEENEDPVEGNEDEQIIPGDEEEARKTIPDPDPPS